MNNDSLQLSVIQSHITWENRPGNLKHYGELLRRINRKTDLAVLPEMFTTGFSMRVNDLSETNEGETITSVKKWATTYDMAIVGSFIAIENGKYYNRAFFITPEGEAYYYDKRHLFTMAGEDKFFEAGNKHLVVNYRGWKICPLICYDLRFPVWSRNIDNQYDLLIYIANWPETRKTAWKSLLQARAIENMAYVCGVNRTGTDGQNFTYLGESLVFTPKGKKLINAGTKEEVIRTCKLKKASLESFRTKFPVWKDADKFSIIE